MDLWRLKTQYIRIDNDGSPEVAAELLSHGVLVDGTHVGLTYFFSTTSDMDRQVIPTDSIDSRMELVPAEPEQ